MHGVRRSQRGRPALLRLPLPRHRFRDPLRRGWPGRPLDLTSQRPGSRRLRPTPEKSGLHDPRPVGARNILWGESPQDPGDIPHALVMGWAPHQPTAKTKKTELVSSNARWEREGNGRGGFRKAPIKFRYRPYPSSASWPYRPYPSSASWPYDHTYATRPSKLRTERDPLSPTRPDRRPERRVQVEVKCWRMVVSFHGLLT